MWGKATEGRRNSPWKGGTGLVGEKGVWGEEVRTEAEPGHVRSAPAAHARYSDWPTQFTVLKDGAGKDSHVMGGWEES